MKTYHIITIGCQMNKSDSERIAGYLERMGLEEEPDKHRAGLVVFATCGVRQAAEDRVYGLVPKIKKNNPECQIVISGCLSEREDVKKRLDKKVDIWLPIRDLPKLDKKIKGLSASGKRDNYLKLNPKYSSRFSAFVPIGNGCDNFCAYCVVPYARGREVYRPAGGILKEVKDLVKKGYKEIILIAQNVNSYRDGKNNFCDLLKMVNDLPGDFWIRFATSHPKDMSEGLIKTIAGRQKICRHIHLPAQAGDNSVLKAMNRKYTIEHYKKLINRARKAMPGASITTDIIVGFPGETRKQFGNTKKLFREAKFDMAYIAQYSPRPGTAAFKLRDDVLPDEKKRREEELMKILRKTGLANNRKYIGRQERVLIEGRNKEGECFGKTGTNKMVAVKGKGDLPAIGQFVALKIKKARDFGLEGEI